MRGKFGLSVVLLTFAALVASESQSFAGCRRGRCGGSSSACGSGGCAMPAAPSDASPSDVPPAPAEGAAKGAVPQSPQDTPSVTSRQPSGTYYVASRRARRGWSRR